METKKSLSKLSLRDVEKALVKKAKEKGQLTENDLSEIFLKASLSEEDFIYCLSYLKEHAIAFDEDAYQENYLGDLEEEDKDDDEEGTNSVNPPKDFSSYESSLSSLGLYFKDISVYPLLTKEQEIALAERIKDGDEEAKDELINSNLRLVASIAAKFNGKSGSLSYQDLISYGNQGLINAAGKFDPKKGCRFSTYASFWIKQAIRRSIPTYGRSIKVPVYIGSALGKIKSVQRKLTQELNRDPTSEEIANRLGKDFTKEKVEDILSYDTPIVSLDKPMGEDEKTTLEEMISDASVDDSALSGYKSEDILQALNVLDPREREMVIYRFGFSEEAPHTLEEVGAKENITRERARQIINVALRKMKERLLVNQDEDEG
ncbi:MAG: RNA polymerase sigma factor RpoD/SigA [Bacilli bacterium]|jgi:RNA polymerase primary sigma factor|nr:RNA polymerase sigma factor RpoD/SigA [Bacilli bacterium]